MHRLCIGPPLILIALGLAGSLACRSRTAEAPAPPPLPDTATSAPAVPPPAPIIAHALGEPITAAEVEALLGPNGGPEAVAEALQLAVGRRLARREAERMGFAAKSGEGPGEHTDRFLAALYSPETSCHNITDSEIAETYGLLKRRFTHPDVFSVLDAQIVCCPRDAAPCLGNQEAEACFDRALPVAEQLYGTMATAGDGDEAAESAARALAKGHPEIVVNRYRFAYDYERPRHDQGGRWVVMDPAIVGAVKSAQPGQTLPPVRTAYGHHVLHVIEHKPKQAGGLEVPEVKERVRAEVCRRVAERTRRQYVMDLGRSVPVELEQDELRALIERHPPRKEPRSEEPPSEGPEAP